MADEPVIARLRPGTDLHDTVLKYLMDRLDFSERKMSKFYARWTAREKQIQAYIDLPNYEKQLKAMNDAGAPPVVTQITIPYSYATISTIATYMIHTFTGRKPVFAVGSNSAEAAMHAPALETLLQFQVDTRFIIKRWMQFFKDGETYGIGAMKCMWELIKRKRTVRKKSLIGETVAVREMRTVYEGNDVENLDPFCFFPDPRVPMNDAPWKAEFIFWRDWIGRHELIQGQSDYGYKHIDSVGTLPQNVSSGGVSARSILVGGDAHPGMQNDSKASTLSFVQRDECTIWIVPSKIVDKFGNALGDGEVPEMWIFTIANKKQIISAEPFEYDHGMHPIITIEPHTVGYGFGQMSTADYLAPLQDAASWFLNTHIHNVRSFLNNMLVVNPALVEMKDVTNPKPGKVIRMKRGAMGVDPRMAVFQLSMSDVTRGHVSDMEAIVRMGDMLSAVNDNLRGIQDAGGRKTATEVRTSGEAGASRLAAQARLYSAQGICSQGMQMTLNSQQFLSREYEMQVLGMDKTIMIGPESIGGEFFFPVHDGTLPLDKVALLDTWKEILLGVARDPQLRAEWNLSKIFEWVAELGGARNISTFRNAPGGQPLALNPVVAPPGVDGQAAIQAGNAIPLPTAVGPANVSVQ